MVNAEMVLMYLDSWTVDEIETVVNDAMEMWPVLKP